MSREALGYMTTGPISGGTQPPVLPSAIREHLANNPDALGALLHPDALAAVASAARNADWCVACGASSGVAARLLGDPADLTDNQIQALSDRIGTAGAGGGGG
jgi:hypothetical protein